MAVGISNPNPRLVPIKDFGTTGFNLADWTRNNDGTYTNTRTGERVSQQEMMQLASSTISQMAQNDPAMAWNLSAMNRPQPLDSAALANQRERSLERRRSAGDPRGLATDPETGLFDVDEYMRLRGERHTNDRGVTGAMLAMGLPAVAGAALAGAGAAGSASGASQLAPITGLPGPISSGSAAAASLPALPALGAPIASMPALPASIGASSLAPISTGVAARGATNLPGTEQVAQMPPRSSILPAGNSQGGPLSRLGDLLRGDGEGGFLSGGLGRGLALGAAGAGLGGLLGGLGDIPEPPPAPNPIDIINAAAQANRIDQITPYGSLTFSGPNRNVANLQLSPELQGLFDAQISTQQGLFGQAQNRLGQLPPSIDFGSLPRAPTLQAPNVAALNAPSLQRNVGVPDLQRSVNLQTSVPGVNLQRSVSDVNLNTTAPRLTGFFQGRPDLQTSVNDVSIQQNIDLQNAVNDIALRSAPSLQRNVEGVDLQRNIDLANQLAQPDIQRNIDALDLSQLGALPEYDAYRDDVERAFFERSSGLLNEQFQRDEERLRQTLANQGLQSGGEGFGAEFGEFNRRRGETFENLSRDAVLFGGQEATRQLGDVLGIRGQGLQESLSSFGAGLERGQFTNQASQQVFENERSALNFLNNALLSEAGFENAAQLEQFGADLSQAGFANQAALQESDFANQTALQRLNADLARAGFTNQSRLTEANFANQASQQRLATDLARAGFSNDAILQELGFQNQSALQQFGAEMNRANFGNQARLDQLLADVQRGNFANQASLNQFGVNLQRGQFANDARLNEANFANQASTNQFGMDLQAGQFSNQAALQGFGIDESIRNQEIQNQLLRNDVASQNFGLSTQELQNQLGARGQSFNELASLLNAQQVNQPQLSNFFGPGQVNTNDAFAMQQSALNNAFNVENQNRQAKKGSAAQLGGTLGAAAIMASDRRLKDEAVKIGEYNGTNVYLFRWNSKAKKLGLKGRAMGVMADEVDSRFVTEQNGYQAVDYGALQHAA